MSYRLETSHVLYKDKQGSPFKFGVVVSNNKNKILLDTDLNIVREYYKYRGVEKGEGWINFVHCRMFLTWDDEDDERSLPKMVIFNEKASYPIMNRNLDGITILDEQFIKVEIKYSSTTYSHFQQ